MVYDIFLFIFTHSHKNISRKRMQKLCQLRWVEVQLEKGTFSESKNVSFILNTVNCHV
jgi:hypothetical protein